jgi:hypothetical protein
VRLLLDRALQRLRVECELAGKTAEANALLPFLTDTGELPPYRAVAASLDLTEGAVKVAVHRLRQRFGAMLRLEVGETVLEPEVEDDARADSRSVHLTPQWLADVTRTLPVSASTAPRACSKTRSRQSTRRDARRRPVTIQVPLGETTSSAVFS